MGRKSLYDNSFVRDWPQIRVHPSKYARLDKMAIANNLTLNVMLDVLLRQLFDAVDKEKKT